MSRDASGADVLVTEHFVTFDGMCWPRPDDEAEVEHRIRYGGFTPHDLAVAASYVAAYKALVAMPERTRRERIRGIRAALTGPDSGTSADGAS